HGPGDVSAGAVRDKRELDGVVAGEWLGRLQPYRYGLVRHLGDDGAVACAALVREYVDLTRTGFRTREFALHGRVLFERRPCRKGFEVVDQRKDFLRRRVNRRAALISEGVGLGRGEDQDRGDDESNDNENGGQHEMFL